MARRPAADVLKDDCRRHFAELVECVGTKKFAQTLGVSTRQVNRILSGAQPNPLERLITCLQAAEPEVGDRALDFICQELGGHFVRHECINSATVNAVRECAEAIAAISDGQVTDLDIREIREAISALSGLIFALKKTQGDGKA
jgi:DNA-binding transcriptional regulator YdaS (Cro superfamily)